MPEQKQSNQKQVALRTEGQIAQWVEAQAEKLAAYLPAEIKGDADSLKRDIILAIMSSQDLQNTLKTTEGQASMYHALRYAASTGLPLNPQLGKAALVPKGGKILYWPMKAGLVDLLMETGQVEYVTADVVHENDEWEPPANPSENYRYVPARKNRGPVDGYFAACRLKDGTTHVKYWTLEQVEEHRKAYSPKTQMPRDGYGIKTVIKQLASGLNLGSKRLDSAVRGEDDTTYGYSTSRDVTPPKGWTGDDLSDALDEQEPDTVEPEHEPDTPEQSDEPESGDLF